MTQVAVPKRGNPLVFIRFGSIHRRPSEIDFDSLCFELEVYKGKLKEAIKKVAESKESFSELWVKQKGRLDSSPPLVRVFKIGDEVFIAMFADAQSYAIPLTDEAKERRVKWLKEVLP